MSAKPLSADEQADIEWGLSYSHGGLDADGVRAYMEPWIATVNHLRSRVAELEGLLEVERQYVADALAGRDA